MKVKLKVMVKATTPGPCFPARHRRHARFAVPARGLLGGLFGGGGGGGEARRAPPRPLAEAEAALVRPLVAETFIGARELGCCYQMAVDGASALAFHKGCDNAGPTLVVAMAECGRVVGGWFPAEFLSSDDYKETDSDFLFVAKGKTLGEAAANGVEVIAKTGGVGPVFDYARGGPQWGGAPPALVIGPPLAPVGGGITGLDAEETAVGTLRTAKSTLGIGYAKTSAGEDSLFGDGVRECRLTDVLVFSAVDLYL